MKAELFPFQKIALNRLRTLSAEALGGYQRTKTPQVVSFTAPTGAGKTIIMASLIESVYFGNEFYPEQQDAIFVWLSDSPQLNEQSKMKIDLKADKIRLNQCVTITEDSFDAEYLEDGKIYFLNTQKLGKNSNLTKHSDARQYTIWETLANTARDKNNRLYIIIDEAHRGMQGDAKDATSIMQKFLKGSAEDSLESMPVVIGMSATPERFNKLVEGTTSTIYRVVVSPEDVRASGLLKDRIIITYPDDTTGNKDMAVLQAAADDWREKWDHWEQYCHEQHYAYVNPIFVIQVENGSGKEISATDLSDCLTKIEDCTGFRFKDGEVVHTFGQTESALIINGLAVRYEEPSRISDDKKIKVVFFKENLSTGWDCPRAETMMSFRHAKDATYIAQLLGRMIRTPMQMHILVDDVLNDVHLYLPYFDKDKVKDVVDELQNTEGGTIPTEIQGQELGRQLYDTLTIKPAPANPKPKTHTLAPGQASLFPVGGFVETNTPAENPVQKTNHAIPTITTDTRAGTTPENPNISYPTQPQTEKREADSVATDTFDREAVMRFINTSGFPTYHIRKVRISSYLNSLYEMARFLTQSGLYPDAAKHVREEIANQIHSHIENLKATGKYDELVSQVLEFKLSTQIFDVFGKSVDNYQIHDLFTTTDTDIDRQLRLAESRLGNEGISRVYGERYYDDENPNSYKVDVIIFVADEECIRKLHEYADDKFHTLLDKYRLKVCILHEKYQKKFDDISSDGDIISKHNFRLPETIQIPHENNGKAYHTHLFVSEKTGTAKINLNSWEEGVIAEEEQREDFVCWLRNQDRKSWSLCIPYQMNNETKATYPDFIIIRKDETIGYIFDILEPHNPDFADNLGKAKGLAEYARENRNIGRIQLIRKGKDAAGNNVFKRLDLTQSRARERVLKATTNDEINHIFEEEGFF